jgi:hypothetical protein
MQQAGRCGVNNGRRSLLTEIISSKQQTQKNMKGRSVQRSAMFAAENPDHYYPKL